MSDLLEHQRRVDALYYAKLITQSERETIQKRINEGFSK